MSLDSLNRKEKIYVDYTVGDFIFENVECHKDLFTKEITLSMEAHSRIIDIYSLLEEAPPDALYQIAPNKYISGTEFFIISEDFDIFIDALTVLKYFEVTNDEYPQKRNSKQNKQEIRLEVNRLNKGILLENLESTDLVIESVKYDRVSYSSEELKFKPKESLEIQTSSNKVEEKIIGNSNIHSHENNKLPIREADILFEALKKPLLKATINIEEKGKTINKGIDSEKLDLGTTQPNRTQRTIVSTERNHSLSQNLKLLYKHQCQICGERIQTGINEYSSEAHHIQPVGGNHKGPDVANNIIIVCPNHHLMFDRGAITIDLYNKKVIHVDKNNSTHHLELVIKHEIEEQYVNYHNKYIFKSLKPLEQPIHMEKKQLANYEKLITLQDLEGEEYDFSLPNQYNKHLMKEVEKLLVYTNKGDIISFNGFTYVVKLIRELE
ncbi:HNH endonuclease [Peribacillus frigoritolerans]|uniref:HNH endonuclease n=1 Tax=Peribacillus frigoritolerans TaxID=450367 RepID=UPI002E236356|nr:HNH endonuclease [Peribacillus frigoritolerans]MED3848847.1 HNH endonuclease [Peribacillus frigoritolerans]